jgi:hypothetical protein
MPNSKWLWLSQAVDRIASRLIEAEPERLSSHSKALKVARDLLLEEAYRGDIQVRGKHADPQVDGRVFQREWTIVNTEFWHPIYRRQRAKSPIKVRLTWERNLFQYEEEGIEWIYDSLQAAADDIDRIWPPQLTIGGEKNRSSEFPPQSIMSPSKDKGGRPSKYQPDLWLEIVRIADLDSLPLTSDGLLDRPTLKRRLMEFSRSRWGSGNEPSKTTIDDLLKLLYEAGKR